MTSGDWQRIKAILDALDECPAAERRALIEEACDGDEALRREVESFLEHEDRLGGFIEEPALPFLAERAPEEAAVDRRIGPYRTVRLLGRGGMGAVYLAVREDEFEQRVALKLLPAGLDTDDMVRRFQNERQIQARLEHPYIARLLDGGTSDGGLPYFAMEYVEGDPIDRYCDARRLDVRGRLELFLKVCSALEFSHRSLVIHRDLKPSNILVDRSGSPKLLDFGIAKLVRARSSPRGDVDFEKSLLTTATGAGLRPMTLRYASPEQLRDDPITTSSDIYSLGLLLYQLLTGRLPCGLESRSDVKLVLAVCEEEPARPSDAVSETEEIPHTDHTVTLTPRSVSRARDLEPQALVRKLAGDVDAIVLQALRKEPRHRYASVEQLAADIRRHLDGRPVEARQGNFAYRAGKFVRRHRWGLATAALVLLLATGFTAALARQLRETSRALSRAETMLGFLENLFRSADPDASAGEELTAREILDLGRVQLRSELADEPEVRAELLNTLGQVYRKLGRFAEAGELLEESVEILQRRHPGDHRKLAAALNDLGTVKLETGDDASAEPLLRESVAMRRRLGDGENLIKPMNNLASLLLSRGALDEAEELFRQGLAIRRGRFGPDHPNVATSLRSVATVLLARGDLAGAEPLLRRALEIQRRVYGPRSPKVALVLSSLGRLEKARGRRAEAEELFTEVLAIRRRQLGERHLHVALTKNDLASLLLTPAEGALVSESELATAHLLLTQALETLYRVKPEGDWNVAYAEGVLGAYLTSRGRFEAAETCLRGSYETLKDRRGPDAAQTRETRRRLDELYDAWGRPDTDAGGP